MPVFEQKRVSLWTDIRLLERDEWIYSTKTSLPKAKIVKKTSFQ